MIVVEGGDDFKNLELEFNFELVLLKCKISFIFKFDLIFDLVKLVWE